MVHGEKMSCGCSACPCAPGACSAGAGAVLFSLPFWDVRHFGHTGLAILVGFLLMDWRYRLSPHRRERIEFGRLVTAAALLQEIVSDVRVPVPAGQPELEDDFAR